MNKYDKFFKDTINKMMEIAGHKLTYDDLPKGEYSELPEEEKENPWFMRYTMTTEQHGEWEKWFVEEYKKRIRNSRKEAKKEFSWLSLAYGLKINDIKS